MAAKKKRLVKTASWFIDQHYALKMKRDGFEAKKKEVNKAIEKLEAEALHKFGKEGIEGAKGKKATGFIQELDHIKIADRRALDKYVKRTGHLELFQNRVSSEAVKELWAQGKKPAGLDTYTSVHFRTRKR